MVPARTQEEPGSGLTAAQQGMAHASRLTLLLGFTFSLVLATLTAASFTAQQSETAEWAMYLILVVLGVPATLLLSAAAPHTDAHQSFVRVALSLAVGTIVLFGGRFVALGVSAATLGSFVLCLLCGILPVLFHLRGVRKGERDSQVGVPGIALWNLLFLSATASLLVLFGTVPGMDGGEIPPAAAAVAVLLTTVLYLAHLRHSRRAIQQAPSSDDLLASSVADMHNATWVLALGWGIVAFFLRIVPVDHFHNNYWLGPVSDVCLGKSLTYDTHSAMGYLVIHFHTLAGRLLGVSYATLTLSDAMLSAMVAGVCFAVLRKISTSGTAFFILLFVLLVKVIVPGDVANSVSRFAFFVFVCGSLVLLPSRWRYFAGCVFSAVALYWAPNTAIRVVPAWGAVMLTMSLVARGGVKERLLGFVIRMALFTGVCCSVCLLSSFIEGHATGGIDALRATMGLAFNRVRGWGEDSVPFASFGAFYFVIILVTSCASVAAYLFIHCPQSRWMPLVSFVAVHNAMLLARLVNRSTSDFTFEIMLPVVIGAGLAWRVMREDLKISPAVLQRLCVLPLCLFVSVTALLVISATLTAPIQNYPEGYRQLFSWAQTRVAGQDEEPFLNRIRGEYGGRDTPLAVVSARLDTYLLVEAGCTNAVPLNPINMTIDCQPPDWPEYFYRDHIDGLSEDTILIFDGGWLASQFMSAVHRRYHLEREAVVRFDHMTAPWDGNSDYAELGVYSLHGRREKILDGDVSLRWACEEGIALDSQSIPALMGLRKMYRNAGDNEGFMATCEHLIRQEPHNGAARAVYGFFIQDTGGDVSQAIEELEASLQQRLPGKTLRSDVTALLNGLKERVHGK